MHHDDGPKDFGRTAGLEARARDGDPPPNHAAAELFGILYRQLHGLARRQLQGSGVTLGATTLIHEAYVGMSSRQPRFPDEARFLAYAARAMRGLVVDHARGRSALKRGGAFHLTGLDARAEDQPAEALSSLSGALDALAAEEPRLAELVDLKFFCGLSFREVAALREVSERTVRRDWNKARLYLHRYLEG